MTSPEMPAYMDPQARDRPTNSPMPGPAPVPRERKESDASRSHGLHRDHYNFTPSSAQSWLFDPALYAALPSSLQNYLLDVSKAGADTYASLERVRVAEKNAEDIDDCYDLFGTGKLASLDRPEHKGVEHSEEDEERYPCSPVLKSRSRSTSNAGTTVASGSSSRSDSFQLEHPSMNFSRVGSPLRSPLHSPIRSPRIISPRPEDLSAAILADPAILSRSHPPASTSSGLSSPTMSRPGNFSTTRFAHHLDLRTQTYVTEVHNFRKQSLPRLRHALQRLTTEWRSCKRQAYVKQRGTSQQHTAFAAEPMPDEQIATEIVGCVVISPEVDAEFEAWVKEKAALVAELEDRSTETGLGLGVGCHWGANGAVAWT